MSDFERHLRLLAVKEDCKGIICGHIHRPENKWINGVHYINSGDWVESLTAIVEHTDGRMEVIDHNTFLRELTNAEDDANENGVFEESVA
jgi:UDP-2,3-diacylglucosamine pyrophosphatase LpxH